MTTTAWAMLTATWAVIIYFTAKYFWMVLQMPDDGDHSEQMHAESSEQDL